MRVVLQRVSECVLRIDGSVHSQIEKGILILVGVHESDTENDCDILSKKCDGLRIFEDENGKMNLSVSDVGGELMVVSNFTLYSDCKKGKRPSFISAARPEHAIPLYERFIQNLLSSGNTVKTGVFGADMKITLINDGPVTVVIDSEDLK